MGHAHNSKESTNSITFVFFSFGMLPNKVFIHLSTIYIGTYIVISLGKSQLFVKAVSILESEAL